MDVTSTIKLNTGSSMPVIGLGTWQLKDNTTETVKQALELGYRMVDTSGNYGNQAEVGRAIKQSSVDRDEIFVVNKVEASDEPVQASRNFVAAMGLDYVDLMLLHWPSKSGNNVALWEGLIRARDEGIVKNIGVSNFSERQLQELIDATGETPSVNQIEWSPFGHSMDILDYCNDMGITVQAYSPLTRTNELNGTRLAEIAENYDCTAAQLILRWNIQLGTVPIPKASSVEHMEENLNIFDFEISDEDMETITNLNESYSAILPNLAYI